MKNISGDLKKVLLIIACARSGSRTLELAERFTGFLENLCATEVKELCLYTELEKGNIFPIDEAFINFRAECSGRGDFSDAVFRCAHLFAEADILVIAAPYWDFSFPSVLKVFLENICVDGLSFRYTADGRPQGLCNASDMVYVSTSGGPVYGDFGYGYTDSLCRLLLGVRNTHLLQAENLDIQGSDTEKILSGAITAAEKTAVKIADRIKRK